MSVTRVGLSRHTPRQLAEAVARAVLDANELLQGVEPRLKAAQLADEVLDVLLQYGVQFADRPAEKARVE